MWITPPEIFYEGIPTIPDGMTIRQWRHAGRPVNDLRVADSSLVDAARTAPRNGATAAPRAPEAQPPLSQQSHRPAPTLPPCGRARCTPEGCFSDRCWVDGGAEAEAERQEIRAERLHGEDVWEMFEGYETDDPTDVPF